MPRYYCDYCDTYLTHDSPSVRKQHNSGYKHKANVRIYYQQFEEQQTQSLIDQRIKEHLGQTAAFQQVGGAYNQHLVTFPQRPRLPILPIPMPMPMPGMTQVPMNSPIPMIRPPVLPRPITSAPGYGPGPGPGPGPMTPSMVGPPGSASLSMQVNGLPRPPMMNPPTAVPGGTPTSNVPPPMMTQSVYQSNSAASVGGVFDYYSTNASSGLQRSATDGSTDGPTNTASQDEFPYSQASPNH